MKVYVLLYWVYDGDSWLIETYEGAYSSYQKALQAKNTRRPKIMLLSGEALEAEKQKGGGYGSPSFCEIREEVLD